MDDKKTEQESQSLKDFVNSSVILDDNQFAKKLRQETHLLKSWFSEKYFTEQALEAGFELEFFLINKHYKLEPENLKFLDSITYNFIVPEVGLGELEINTDHYFLRENVFDMFSQCIQSMWDICKLHAVNRGLELLQIGLLPNAEQDVYSGKYLTPRERYMIMNEKILSGSENRKIQIDIKGEDELAMSVSSIAAAGIVAAFQIHLRVSLSQSHHYYNTALALSGPMLAIASNSYCIQNKALWHETRIPYYEQLLSVNVDKHLGLKRLANLGSGYLKNSLYELYIENMNDYPSLLPINMMQKTEKMWAVRLQNSTIYRWVRPVIDLSTPESPHLRIEFRPLPSGPSVIDMVANAALFIGMVEYFVNKEDPLAERISFQTTQDNFYRAAREGIFSTLQWTDGQKLSVSDLYLRYLLPAAKAGLRLLAIDETDIQYYLGIIEKRAALRRTPSAWQKAFMDKHGHQSDALVKAYLARQNDGMPVHEWFHDM